MLEPNYLFNISNKVIDLYSELENSIIRDIVRRIINAGTMTQSARHQIEILQQAGMLYDDIIKKVSSMTGISENIVNNLFREAGTRTLEYDDYVYRKAGLNPIPINQSKTMLNILKRNTRITNKSLYNLALSTALTGKNKFIELSDVAIFQTQTGAFDYNTAIWNAIKNVTDSGIYVQYPSGRKDKIDVAVRRNVMTAISQTAGNLQEERANEMNCDLVEVSAHVGARPSHELWQGKIFSRSGNSKKYPDFIESTGYGTATGLCGINCRHSFYPYYEGLSEPSYTQEELDEINNKTVSYNGKEIKEYDALQIQRGMERNIRQNKREISACEGILTSNADEKLKSEANNKISVLSKNLREKQSKLKDFTEQTGLVRQYVRERVPSYNKHIDKTVDNINKSNTFYDNVGISNDTMPNNEYGRSKYLNENAKELCNEIFKKFESNGYENIGIINVKNNEVLGEIHTSNIKERVTFSIKQENLLAMQDNRSVLVVHNHPGNDTFSGNDIFTLIENKKICGIIATGHDYNYFLEIGEKDLENINKKRFSIKEEIWSEVLEKVNLVIKGSRENSNLLTNEVMHNIYKDVFNKRGWNYGRKRRN